LDKLAYNVGTYPQPFQPQMRGVIADEVIGNEPTLSRVVTSAQQSIGESFTSIKQLLNRNSMALPGINNSGGISLWPWWCNIANQNQATGLYITDTTALDPFSIFGPMYMFYRGGADVAISNNIESSAGDFSIGAYLDVVNSVNNGLWLTTADVPDGVWSSGHAAAPCGGFTFTDAQGSCQFHVPYMSANRMSLLLPGRGAPTPFRPTTGSQPLSKVAITWYTTQLAPAVMRSFSDDFQLSMFLCCPPQAVAYS